MSKILTVCTTILVLAALASPAAATILIKKNIGQLCAESERIVIGRVVAQNAAWTPGRKLIFTHTTLEIERTLKGVHSKKLVVSEIGGRVGDITCHVASMPKFKIGQTVLLTLKKDPLGHWRTHGAIQGRFTVTKNRATGERIVPTPKGLEHVTKKFFPSEHLNDRGVILFEDFCDKVEELVAKSKKGGEKK